ncbi:MAG: hypothetical protein ACOVK9_02105, partial [Bacteroidia bacterium]
SILMLLVFGILSFIKTDNLRFQLIYVVVATFNIAVLATIIGISYNNQSALIFPALLLLHVVNKAKEIYKML